MNETTNAATAAPEAITQQTIEQWLIAWLSKELSIEATDIQVEEEFVNLGVGSRQAVFMMGDLEDWLAIELDPSAAWDYPTIGDLAQYLLSLHQQNGA